MKKNYYVVTAPENGWDCVCGIYLAENKDKVWEALCQNEGDTVESLKKRRYYVIHLQYKLEEL